MDAFKVFHASLSSLNMSHVSLYVDKSIPKYSYEIIKKRNNKNLNEMVLSRKHFKLNELNIKLFSQWIRERRIMLGMPKIHVAEYLGMSKASLRAHEEGRRIRRIDIFFKILLLYNIENLNLDEIIIKHGEQYGLFKDI